MSATITPPPNSVNCVNSVSPFDPQSHVISLGRRGCKEQLYLPVRWRLVWFREQHPDWGIETEPVSIDLERQTAVFRARVVNAEGRVVATGTKMESAAHFGDWVEKAECVPTDVSILTQEGWKLHNDLRIGEPVLSYDLKTDSAHWVPLQRVVVYPNAPVVRLHNGWGFDACCTPDHKWPVRYSASWKGRQYDYNALIPADKLRTNHRIVTACMAPSGHSQCPPAIAGIMGWLMTDGGFRREGKSLHGMIYQSKPAQIALIEKTLREAGLDHSVYDCPGGPMMLPQGKVYDCLPQRRWRLSAEAMRLIYAALEIDHEMEIERTLPLLSYEARAAMLLSMMAADADERGSFGKKRKPWVMPAFGLLCALQGLALPRYTYSTIGGVPLQRVKRTRHTWASNLKSESVGSSEVWCPTTAFGTWYARYPNGFQTITGNTGAIGRALAVCGFGTQFSGDLEEGPRLVDSPVAAPTEPARKPARGPEAKPCETCGARLTAGQAAYSEFQYGKPLCPACQR